MISRDGENDLSAIIDISGKDDFLVAKTLPTLMEKGIIEATKSAPLVAEGFPEKVKKRLKSFYFLASLAIAISILLSLVPVFSKKDDIFKKFRASATIEELRLAIETYKFEHGSYPVTLDVVSEKSDPWGRPYVYTRGENTFSILSKGQMGEKEPQTIFAEGER